MSHETKRQRRRWTRADQIKLEKPPEPLIAACPVHKPYRTVVLRPREVTTAADGTTISTVSDHCLRCHGCPHCGTRGQITTDYTDDGLRRRPITLEGRKIRGDWTCIPCGEVVVAWSNWRYAMLKWAGLSQARKGGYRRPEERRSAA